MCVPTSHFPRLSYLVRLGRHGGNHNCKKSQFKITESDRRESHDTSVRKVSEKSLVSHQGDTGCLVERAGSDFPSEREDRKKGPMTNDRIQNPFTSVFSFVVRPFNTNN